MAGCERIRQEELVNGACGSEIRDIVEDLVQQLPKQATSNTKPPNSSPTQSSFLCSACSKKSDPVCFNGKTYKNLCQAMCRSALSPLSNSSLTSLTSSTLTRGRCGQGKKNKNPDQPSTKPQCNCDSTPMPLCFIPEGGNKVPFELPSVCSLICAPYIPPGRVVMGSC